MAFKTNEFQQITMNELISLKLQNYIHADDLNEVIYYHNQRTLQVD